MKEIILVPEWKLPLIQCQSCKYRYFLIGFIGKTDDEMKPGDEPGPGCIPVCKSFFCPWCGTTEKKNET